MTTQLNKEGTNEVGILLDTLYKQRNDLLTLGFEWDSAEVEAIENKIEEIEVLPSFEEVLEMISEGTLISIHGGTR